MSGFIPDLKTKVFGAAEEAVEKVSEVKETVVKEVEDWKEEKMRMLKAFEDEKKALLRTAVVSRADRLYSFGMNVTGNIIKKKMKDPYMPDFVKVMVDELVDTFWPDVTGEVKDIILTGIAPKQIIDHGPPPGCGGCGCSPLSWLRYTLLPYDRTFWRLIRHPFWWLFTLASLVPKYGIGMMAYMLYFFILDCGDQYQMESYIVDFKALQFITLGVLMAIVGAVQYYLCISATPPNCDDGWAPREEIWTLAIFVLQVFFVWLAFCLLQKGKKKGGYHHMYDEATKAKMESQMTNGPDALQQIALEEPSFTGSLFADIQFKNEEELCERARSRLFKFLIYDIIIFLLCIGVCCFFIFANLLDQSAQPDFTDWDTWDTKKNWKLGMSFFWVKALYGLLSFPFAMLKIPGLKNVISHAKRTGYNPYGRCVVFVGEEEEPHLCPWKPGPHSTGFRIPLPGSTPA